MKDLIRASRPPRWTLLALLGLLLFSGGNFGLLAAHYLGYDRVAPVDLPPGARDLTDLGHGWHTFRLRIAGKDRVFLRRLYPNQNNTESLSELVDPKTETPVEDPEDAEPVVVPAHGVRDRP